MFFESLAECSFGFNYVCVADVDVTRDVIDGSTLVFFWCFFLPSSRGCLQACCTCVCCVTYKSSQANPATYGSPSIGGHWLWFVLG